MTSGAEGPSSHMAAQPSSHWSLRQRQRQHPSSLVPIAPLAWRFRRQLSTVSASPSVQVTALAPTRARQTPTTPAPQPSSRQRRPDAATGTSHQYAGLISLYGDDGGMSNGFSLS